MTTPRYPADIEAAVKADRRPHWMAAIKVVQVELAATAPLIMDRKADNERPRTR